VAVAVAMAMAKFNTRHPFPKGFGTGMTLAFATQGAAEAGEARYLPRGRRCRGGWHRRATSRAARHARIERRVTRHVRAVAAAGDQVHKIRQTMIG